MYRLLMLLLAILLVAADAPSEAGKTPAIWAANANDSQFEGVLWIVGPAVGIICLGAVLFWWLRRGDRTARSRIAEVRQGQFAMPSDEPLEQAPPAADAGPPRQT